MKELQANELRIGNIIHEHWFTPNEDVVKIVDTYILICVQAPKSDLDLGEYRPIPLTEEWLLKCGFNDVRKVDNTDFKEYRSFLNYSFCIQFPLGIEAHCYAGNYPIAIKYLHQLQNLYFALIGEELKIE